jgi:hypothetical protein
MATVELDAEARRISELTTQELQQELKEQGLHKLLLRQPALTKAALRAKYVRKVRQRRERTAGRVISGSSSQQNVATTTDADAEGPDDRDDDTESGRQCNLKALLNWHVRVLYTGTISTLVVELLLQHFAASTVGDEGTSSDPAAGAASTAAVVAANGGGGGGSTRGPVECLTAVGVVFTTYVIFHRALGKTNTQVYWIQVVTSLFWLGFLAALVSSSKSCAAVLQRGQRAAAACGLEAEADAVGAVLRGWLAAAFPPAGQQQHH